MIPYLVVIVLNFLYRFSYIDRKGMCIIGLEAISMIPLIAFDVVVNVYLTILFLVPLWGLYSFRNKLNMALRRMALRAFIGSVVTLSSSVANLLTIMLLKGEPGYICLMCCNADILFSVVVLHWMISGDRETPRTSWPEQAAAPPEPKTISTTRGPKGFNLDGTISEFDTNTTRLAGTRRDGIVSYVISEESVPQNESSGEKEVSSVGSKETEEDRSTIGRIMKRTSLTVESTREGSISSIIALA